MTTDRQQVTLSSLWYEYFARLIRWETRATTEDVRRALIEELRDSQRICEDAIVYTMARTLDQGMIAQLTFDANDPGFVNRALGATEAFYVRDYCGAAWRKRCGVASAVRTYTPEAFLARDETGTLAKRSQAFEEAFIALLRSKLAS